MLLVSHNLIIYLLTTASTILGGSVYTPAENSLVSISEARPEVRREKTLGGRSEGAPRRPGSKAMSSNCEAPGSGKRGWSGSTRQNVSTALRPHFVSASPSFDAGQPNGTLSTRGNRTGTNPLIPRRSPPENRNEGVFFQSPDATMGGEESANNAYASGGSGSGSGSGREFFSQEDSVVPKKIEEVSEERVSSLLSKVQRTVVTPDPTLELAQKLLPTSGKAFEVNQAPIPVKVSKVNQAPIPKVSEVNPTPIPVKVSEVNQAPVPELAPIPVPSPGHPFVAELGEAEKKHLANRLGQEFLERIKLSRGAEGDSLGSAIKKAAANGVEQVTENIKSREEAANHASGEQANQKGEAHEKLAIPVPPPAPRSFVIAPGENEKKRLANQLGREVLKGFKLKTVATVREEIEARAQSGEKLTGPTIEEQINDKKEVLEMLKQSLEAQTRALEEVISRQAITDKEIIERNKRIKEIRNGLRNDKLLLAQSEDQLKALVFVERSFERIRKLREERLKKEAAAARASGEAAIEVKEGSLSPEETLGQESANQILPLLTKNGQTNLLKDQRLSAELRDLNSGQVNALSKLLLDELPALRLFAIRKNIADIRSQNFVEENTERNVEATLRDKGKERGGPADRGEELEADRNIESPLTPSQPKVRERIEEPTHNGYNVGMLNRVQVDPQPDEDDEEWINEDYDDNESPATPAKAENVEQKPEPAPRVEKKVVKTATEEARDTFETLKNALSAELPSDEEARKFLLTTERLMKAANLPLEVKQPEDERIIRNRLKDVGVVRNVLLAAQPQSAKEKRKALSAAKRLMEAVQQEKNKATEDTGDLIRNTLLARRASLESKKVGETPKQAAEREKKKEAKRAAKIAAKEDWED